MASIITVTLTCMEGGENALDSIHAETPVQPSVLLFLSVSNLFLQRYAVSLSTNTCVLM